MTIQMKMKMSKIKIIKMMMGQKKIRALTIAQNCKS